jgi:bifunctional UDP-N-acetylglucosamine pyrophosphorylase/glucosamine-1-phosphate N-acetyltransferase
VVKAAGYEYVLVLNGDVPLIGVDDIKACIAVAAEHKADLAFLTITLPDPGAYGRVVRKAKGHAVIVEAKDYDEKAHGRPTGEINAGIYCLRVSAVDKVLFDLTNTNKGGEFYITDLAGLVAEAGGAVVAVSRGSEANLLGINTPAELAQAEETLRGRIVESWLARGVVIRQKESMRIGPKARLAPGCEICGQGDILGDSIIESGAVIAPHVWIKDSTIGARARVHAFSHLEGAALGTDAEAGPFARLRPGAILEEGARVGNFVELKKSVLGPNAKAGHLSYLGDAVIGAGVNVGAGTITCNYDGKNKFTTVIGKNAFIGSNTALVAPVNVGENALVAAGSVITEDVPDNALAIARGRQTTKKRKPDLA